MRIAAGIILIIAAVINIVAALGYLGGGALSSAGGASALSKALQEESAKSANTADTSAALAKLQQATDNAPSGKALMGFGAFLLVTVVTSIAGAVCLFRSKAAKFVIVASGLALAAEVIGSLIIGFGPGKILGLVGGILGILGARSIMAKNAPPEAMPPVAPAPM
jgi:hypothetical protein